MRFNPARLRWFDEAAYDTLLHCQGFLPTYAFASRDTSRYLEIPGMTFVRNISEKWHGDVPGARWFKADLHVHTIDDMPGGKVGLPDDLNGPLDSEETICAYARLFLQSAVERQVGVIGVTPHSPHIDTNPNFSAVWRIVEEWNSGVDDDEIPFREKIYAVFPGFEPSLDHGRSGLHLLFLFDPEIGYESFLRAFSIVMGTQSSSWRDNQLQLSSIGPEETFRKLREFHHQEQSEHSSTGSSVWNYITLAPHIDSEKGLLGAQRAQVLSSFQHGEVAGLELGDEKMPDETLKKRPWLASGMKDHHQAFFHSSDAYALGDIGRRHTWIKLASPKIEALRQAFIANDSRIRLGYERNGDGCLKEITDSPDVTVNKRPWLKSVTIKGSASFFSSGGDGLDCRFDLSPDLTCIIGGSMTGKSTFLDGLRVYVKASLPEDENLGKQVEARGRNRFLGGSPDVALDCPGSEPTAPNHEKWPAVFFAQNELQRLAEESEQIENILSRLVISETHDIADREKRMKAFDLELKSTARRLAKLDGDLADAEQAWDRSRSASEALEAFSDAGIEKLHEASRYLRQWQDFEKSIDDVGANLDCTLKSVEVTDPPQIDAYLSNVLRNAEKDLIASAEAALQDEEFKTVWKNVHTYLQRARSEMTRTEIITRIVKEVLTANEQAVRTEVDQALASRGMDAAKIREYQALSRQAGLKVSYKANLDRFVKRSNPKSVHSRICLPKEVTSATSSVQRSIV